MNGQVILHALQVILTQLPHYMKYSYSETIIVVLRFLIRLLRNLGSRFLLPDRWMLPYLVPPLWHGAHVFLIH
jgi:hypothetical protein